MYKASCTLTTNLAPSRSFYDEMLTNQRLQKEAVDKANQKKLDIQKKKELKQVGYYEFIIFLLRCSQDAPYFHHKGKVWVIIVSSQNLIRCSN